MASSSHEIGLCRALYQGTRDNGAPVVNIHDFGEGFYVGESADGRVRIEGVTGCCRWAMKYEVARRWLEQRRTHHEKSKR